MTIQNFLPKKSILVISFIFTLLFVFYLYLYQACHNGAPLCSLTLKYAGAINIFIVIGLPLLVVFPLSLLTYWLDERVYGSWIPFAAIVAPVISFILFWTSQQSINELGGGAVIAFVVFLGILFFVVSLGIIIWKWFSIRKRLIVKMKK